MSRKTVKKQYILCITLLVLSLLVLCFTPILAGVSGAADSPEAVFKVAQTAGEQKDFAALTKLVAPTEHSLLAFGTDMAVGMTVEFYEGEKAPELKKRYQEIQKKYNIKEETEGPKLKITNDTPQSVIDAHIRKRAENLYGKIDVEKYVPDLMGIVLSLPEMADTAFIPNDKLTHVKIDGDRATGMAGEKTISFVRLDNQWFLTADIME